MMKKGFLLLLGLCMGLMPLTVCGKPEKTGGEEEKKLTIEFILSSCEGCKEETAIYFLLSKEEMSTCESPQYPLEYEGDEWILVGETSNTLSLTTASDSVYYIIYDDIDLDGKFDPQNEPAAQGEISFSGAEITQTVALGLLDCSEDTGGSTGENTSVSMDETTGGTSSLSQEESSGEESTSKLSDDETGGTSSSEETTSVESTTSEGSSHQEGSTSGDAECGLEGCTVVVSINIPDSSFSPAYIVAEFTKQPWTPQAKVSGTGRVIVLTLSDVKDCRSDGDYPEYCEFNINAGGIWVVSGSPCQPQRADFDIWAQVDGKKRPLTYAKNSQNGCNALFPLEK